MLKLVFFSIKNSKIIIKNYLQLKIALASFQQGMLN